VVICLAHLAALAALGSPNRTTPVVAPYYILKATLQCGSKLGMDGIRLLEHLHPSRLSASGKRLRGERRLVCPMLATGSEDVDECEFSRTADAFRAKRREGGPHRSSEKRPRSFVSAPQSIAAAESPKIQLSRDFRCRPIFDFCNTIPSTADIHPNGRQVRFVPNSRQTRQSI
jgi:hypothetical protein